MQPTNTETETELKSELSTSPDDAALVRQVLEEKDADAFSTLYNRYFARVYNFMRYRVQDAAITDDLTAQVFEGMLKGLRTYNPNIAPFGAWLFGLARRVVGDFYRQSNRQESIGTHISLDVLHEQASHVSLLEEYLIAHERHQMLLAAVARLSERERDLIALKYGAGLTNRQIASQVGLSESNVGVILHRSLKQLRVLLPQE